ncbi:MAG: VWA domain-containing protein [Leptospiraceae bacterium]|nr:VWA domain-containing protein [Leptospiraceae bacterium]
MIAAKWRWSTGLVCLALLLSGPHCAQWLTREDRDNTNVTDFTDDQNHPDSEESSETDRRNQEESNTDTTAVDTENGRTEEQSDPDQQVDNTAVDEGGATDVRPIRSGLSASFADDNRQFNYFLQFLDKYAAQARSIALPVRERIVLRVRDASGKPVANARLNISGGERALNGTTYADGSYLFFPQLVGGGPDYQVRVNYHNQSANLSIRRQGNREVVIALSEERVLPERPDVDLVFIFDTTGSMDEEIARLKRTIEIIQYNLSEMSVRPRVRFGMVLYRDIHDEYRTKVIPLTDDLRAFQAELNQVEAHGGGDGPEDLQAALQDALTKLNWNQNGVRMGFIITDAPPHLDYNQSYDYKSAVEDAQSRGIKIFGIGTGGLDINGEYVLRQIAQYTYARYIFLTYGEETGENAGGVSGSVSHHTGANYNSEKLEAIIIRFAREEIAHLTDRPLDDGTEEDYFLAESVDAAEREAILRELFRRSINQLLDYSMIKVERGTTLARLPLTVVHTRDLNADDQKANAEFFAQQISYALSKNETFRVVEREDLQQILSELELQQSGLIDEEQASELGRLLGSDLLLAGKMISSADRHEVFLRLIRVETGEVLAVSRAIIDAKLGLAYR